MAVQEYDIHGYRPIKEGKRYVLWEHEKGYFIIEQGLWTGLVVSSGDRVDIWGEDSERKFRSHDRAERHLEALEAGKIPITYSEAALKEIIGCNPTVIEPGLRIIKREMNLAEGRIIDILAENAEHELIMIELKVVEASGEAVSQLIDYITSARQIVGPVRAVKGMLIAPGFNSRAMALADRLPDVKLVKYRDEGGRLTFQVVQTAGELARRRALVKRMLGIRSTLPPLGMTTAELVRMARKGLEAYDEE